MSQASLYLIGISIGLFLFLSYQAIFRRSLSKQTVSLSRPDGIIDLPENQLHAANISPEKACDILRTKYKIEPQTSLKSLSRSVSYYWTKLECTIVLRISNSSVGPNYGMVSDIAIPRIPESITEWCSAMKVKHNVLPVSRNIFESTILSNN